MNDPRPPGPAARASVEPNPGLGFVPRTLHGVPEMPVYHMRGGTSTGIVLWADHLPEELGLREEAIRLIMGVPARGESRGNRQASGLGRGIPTSNKVFLLASSRRTDADLDSTLAQLAADKAAIDWSVNCGNMTAALPMYALDAGLYRPQGDDTVLRVFNTNTGVITDARMRTPGGALPHPADTEIPGVLGRFPGVDLSLRDPVGAKTGRLLPTGRPRDVFEGVEASVVDVAVPMVILRAADLGKRGDEPNDELARDTDLKARLRAIWVAAGLAAGLSRDGRPMTAEELAGSETVPKVCLVSPDAAGAHIQVRYFTPQAPHNSLAVTGGCCLASACLIPGTTAHELASGLAPPDGEPSERLVAMRNPAGVLRARIVARAVPGGVEIARAAYERSAQIFLRGHVPLYDASPALAAFVASWRPRH